MKWDVVPKRFHYLRAATELCGTARIEHFVGDLGRHASFLEGASPSQISVLTTALEACESRRDMSAIEAWVKTAENGRPSEKEAAWGIRGLLMVFEEMKPTSNRSYETASDSSNDNCKTGVLSQVPAHLAYLCEAARMIRAESESDAMKFINSCSREQSRMLEDVGRRARADNAFAQVNRLLEASPLGSHKESAWIYFLFAALDYAAIDFERDEDEE